MPSKWPRCTHYPWVWWSSTPSPPIERFVYKWPSFWCTSICRLLSSGVWMIYWACWSPTWSSGMRMCWRPATSLVSMCWSNGPMRCWITIRSSWMSIRRSNSRNWSRGPPWVECSNCCRSYSPSRSSSTTSCDATRAGSCSSSACWAPQSSFSTWVYATNAPSLMVRYSRSKRRRFKRRPSSCFKLSSASFPRILRHKMFY